MVIELNTISFIYSLSPGSRSGLGDLRPQLRVFDKVCHALSSSHQVLWFISGIVSFAIKNSHPKLILTYFHHNGIIYTIFDTEISQIGTKLTRMSILVNI